MYYVVCQAIHSGAGAAALIILSFLISLARPARLYMYMMYSYYEYVRSMTVVMTWRLSNILVGRGDQQQMSCQASRQS